MRYLKDHEWQVYRDVNVQGHSKSRDIHWNNSFTDGAKVCTIMHLSSSLLHLCPDIMLFPYLLIKDRRCTRSSLRVATSQCALQLVGLTRLTVECSHRDQSRRNRRSVDETTTLRTSSQRVGSPQVYHGLYQQLRSNRLAYECINTLLVRIRRFGTDATI